MNKVTIVVLHTVCLLAKLGRKPVGFHLAGIARVFHPKLNERRRMKKA